MPIDPAAAAAKGSIRDSRLGARSLRHSRPRGRLRNRADRETFLPHRDQAYVCLLVAVAGSHVGSGHSQNRSAGEFCLHAFGRRVLSGGASPQRNSEKGRDRQG